MNQDNDAAHYYEHWVAALEGLVTAKGLTDAQNRSIAANMPGLRRIVGRRTASRSNWGADPAVQTILRTCRQDWRAPAVPDNGLRSNPTGVAKCWTMLRIAVGPTRRNTVW